MLADLSQELQSPLQYGITIKQRDARQALTKIILNGLDLNLTLPGTLAIRVIFKAH